MNPKIVSHANAQIVRTYEKIDALVLKAVKASYDTGREVSCKKGCNHCCYIVAITAIAEGVLIATEVQRKSRNEKRRLINRLKSSALDLNTTNAEHFVRNKPCAFLNLGTGECAIYPIRPASCRCYQVTTPPDLCKPDSKALVSALDLVHLENVVQIESFSLAGNIIIAPLANMVLFCLDGLGGAKGKIMKGTVYPEQWMHAAGERMKIASIEPGSHLRRGEV